MDMASLHFGTSKDKDIDAQTGVDSLMQCPPPAPLGTGVMV